MPVSSRPAAGPNALAMLMIVFMSAGSGEGATDEIETKSADQTSEDEPERVKWEKLPAPALQTICGYLIDRPVPGYYGPSLHGESSSLDAFRKTCSQFATAVNSFLKNPRNLPAIARLEVNDKGAQPSLEIVMPTAHYALHPLRDLPLRELYGVWHRRTRSNTRQLQGCVVSAQLSLVKDLTRFKRLIRNIISIGSLKITCNVLGDAMSADLLELVAAYSITNLSLDFHAHRLSDPVSFITQLEATGVSVFVRWLNPYRGCVRFRPPFLGIQNDFWKDLLRRKLQEQRWRVECDERNLTPTALPWAFEPSEAVAWRIMHERRV